LAMAMILLAIACLTSSAQPPVRRVAQVISRADAQDAPHLRVEVLAVREWGDRHGARHFSGESATVTQLTGV
jgi:hypothetical protein